MVRIQAQTMRPATPQRTADSLVVAPTPTIATVITSVVDARMPATALMARVVAPAVSAARPPTGLSLVIFIPIVLTMRQPPKAVPSPWRYDTAATPRKECDPRRLACVRPRGYQR